MKRRSFLRSAVSIPFIVPAAAVCVTAQGQTMPNDKVVLGFIGTGRQCFYHNIPGFVRNKQTQTVAVCDVDSRRLGEAKKRVAEIYAKSASLTKPAEIKAYTDYRELLERSDIDAVMISTPDHWHARQAVDAMKAGKHVALEKPIIRTIAEGQTLVKTAAETKRIFRVDSEFRSGKAAHRAAELVRSGRLGAIRNVLVCVPSTDVPCPPQPDMPVPPELDYERWRGDTPEASYTEKRVHTPHNINERPGWMRHLYYCDGMVTNWGTHLFNGALWALGLDRTFPVEVEGTGEYPDADSFWNVLLRFVINYRYENGVRITYRADKPFYRIEGERGTLTVSFDWSKDVPGGIQAEPASLLDEKIGADEIHFPLRSEKEDFIDCVLNNKETLEPAIVGHCVTSSLLLGHIAVRTGENVKFDPKTQTFIDSPKSAAYLSKRIETSRDEV